MHASTTYNNSGSKATKIAIVTALHVGVALALISMKVHGPTLPPVIVDPITQPIDTPPPPPPVEVDMTTKKIEPTLFVPKTEVETMPTPDVAPIAKTLPPGPLPEVSKEKVVKGGGEGIAQEQPKKIPYTPATDGNCARPDYPASAARMGEAGTVSLALLIGANGKVSDAKVEHSSGSRVLDRAAVAALSLCQFKPATNNGVAEPAWGKIAYVWTLD